MKLISEKFAFLILRMLVLFNLKHCVKGVRIRSYSGPQTLFTQRKVLFFLKSRLL